jgi:hypothetical protein
MFPPSAPAANDNDAPVTGGNSTPMFILWGAPAQDANKVMSPHFGPQQWQAGSSPRRHVVGEQAVATASSGCASRWDAVAALQLSCRGARQRQTGRGNTGIPADCRELGTGCNAGGWRRSMSGSKKRMLLWFWGCWTILGQLLGCSWVRVLGCHRKHYAWAAWSYPY